MKKKTSEDGVKPSEDDRCPFDEQYNSSENEREPFVEQEKRSLNIRLDNRNIKNIS